MQKCKLKACIHLTTTPINKFTSKCTCSLCCVNNCPHASQNKLPEFRIEHARARHFPTFVCSSEFGEISPMYVVEPSTQAASTMFAVSSSNWMIKFAISPLTFTKRSAMISSAWCEYFQLSHQPTLRQHSFFSKITHLLEPLNLGIFAKRSEPLHWQNQCKRQQKRLHVVEQLSVWDKLRQIDKNKINTCTTQQQQNNEQTLKHRAQARVRAYEKKEMNNDVQKRNERNSQQNTSTLKCEIVEHVNKNVKTIQ